MLKLIVYFLIIYEAALLLQQLEDEKMQEDCATEEVVSMVN